MSQLPTTMTAVTLNGHGGPEMLELRTGRPLPKIGPEDVLVQFWQQREQHRHQHPQAWYSKQRAMQKMPAGPDSLSNFPAYKALMCADRSSQQAKTSNRI